VNVIIIAAIVWLVLGWIGLVLLVANARRNRHATPERPSPRVPPKGSSRPRRRMAWYYGGWTGWDFPSNRPSRPRRRIGWHYGGGTGSDSGHDRSTDDWGGGDFGGGSDWGGGDFAGGSDSGGDGGGGSDGGGDGGGD
jgi:hypothetical protein